MYVLVTLVQVMAAYCEQRLDLMLREGLTRHLIGRYLANRTYYRLTSRSDIDNPDQRITEDVRNFTQMAVSFALVLLNATLALIGFVGVLWSITPRLVGVAFAYATIGSVADDRDRPAAGAAEFPAAQEGGGLPLRADPHPRERRSDRDARLRGRRRAAAGRPAGRRWWRTSSRS